MAAKEAAAPAVHGQEGGAHTPRNRRARSALIAHHALFAGMDRLTGLFLIGSPYNGSRNGSTRQTRSSQPIIAMRDATRFDDTGNPHPAKTVVEEKTERRERCSILALQYR